MEEDIINKKNGNGVAGEVLPYKSSFAKSIVVNYRDLKTINNNDIKIENNISENNTTGNTSANINNIFSSKMTLPMDETKNHEIDQLRKQCQDLNEENQRLQSLLQTNQTPRVQAIDNVLLQTQIDTLTWQMKQNEASQQMYRSLMRQMLNFLERARKSLDIIHERTNPIGKNKSSRNSQNLSIYLDEPELITSSTITNTKFTRAKSITQISSSSSSSSSTSTTTTQNSYSGIRDFTWSVLRKNDTSLNCSTPKIKNNNNKIIKKSDLNKPEDSIVKRRTNNNITNEINEENDDYVPPNKLSQESFRLMRTIESLLTTISSSPFSSTLSSASSTSSLSINEKDSTTAANNKKDIDDNNNNNNNNKRINSLSTNDGSFIDDDYSFKQINDTFIVADENNKKYNNNNIIIKNNKNISKKLFNGNCSTNIRLQINKTATINDNELSILRDDKPSSSIVNNINNNSADDESGFSSMNSFQDVGIPVTSTTTSSTTTTTTTILPINNSPGLHTEIGLPDVPIDKNIKWPSNTIDLQLKIKNYKNEYINNNSSNNNNRAKVEQRSVWV